MFYYKEEEQCQNETCGFTCPRKDRMKRHHENCRDTTEIVTKKICYGLKEEKYMSVIPDSYFENPKFLFAVFDIETAERPCDFAEVGILNIWNITNISGIVGYPIDWVDFKLGQSVTLFRTWIFKLRRWLQNGCQLSRQTTWASWKVPRNIAKWNWKRIGISSGKIQNISFVADIYNIWIILKLQEESCTWKEKQALFARKSFLKNLKMFNIFGFNSSKFDLAVLIPYIGKYAEEKGKTLNVLKRGNNSIYLKYLKCFRIKIFQYQYWQSDIQGYSAIFCSLLIGKVFESMVHWWTKKDDVPISGFPINWRDTSMCWISTVWSFL